MYTYFELFIIIVIVLLLLALTLFLFFWLYIYFLLFPDTAIIITLLFSYFVLFCCCVSDTYPFYYPEFILHLPLTCFFLRIFFWCCMICSNLSIKNSLSLFAVSLNFLEIVLICLPLITLFWVEGLYPHCKKGSFPLGIFSVNLIKSEGNCGIGYFYWRNR